MNFKEHASLYRKELLEQVIPFWLQYSIDSQCGGYFTCLDESGQVYDTDKFIWLQARQVWMFAALFNRVEQKQEWLDTALHGAAFLLKHGRAPNQQWYFSLNRQGQPLVQPYNIFSDCFAAMALGELYKATKKQQYKDIAIFTFEGIRNRQKNPKGQWSKQTTTRTLKNFSLPMILCNLGLVLEEVVGQTQVDSLLKPLANTILEEFLDKGQNVLMENIGPNGQLVDCFEGRVVNAGHGNESVWFLLDLAKRFNDGEMAKKCVSILLSTLDFAWDKEHGGLYYFLDIKGRPPMQLEWDQKLWWVHIETMIALMKSYRHTKDQRCLEWFKRVHEYTWRHFRDEKRGGEWFGYLRRDGSVLMPAKGGKWKGCFHVPRGLLQLWLGFEELSISE